MSGVFQNIDPPTPSPPSECVLPPHQRRGLHTRRAVKGCGINIVEDARHWIGFLQYNPSTGKPKTLTYQLTGRSKSLTYQLAGICLNF